MSLKIDHIVIVVKELDLALSDYGALGFTVVPGGEHADGLTHNALIAFADGSYLELIAFKQAPPPSHLFARALEWGGGIVTYALLPGDIKRTIEEAHERGLDITGPQPGGRVKPDGTQISWQTSRPATNDLPFLCADVTPRQRRVPGGAARQHSNGVTGIANITIVVADPAASTERYRALLGIKEETKGQNSLFRLGKTTITLSPGTTGHMHEYLMARGDTPYSLTLRTKGKTAPALPNPALTHGVIVEYETSQGKQE